MIVKLNNDSNEYIETVSEPHFKKLKTVKKGVGPKRTCYVKTPAFFDTETSHNHDSENPIGWIYQWCLEFAGEVFIGRTPSEFIDLLDKLIEVFELSEEKKLVLYAHNLSYDLTYLIQFLYEHYGAGSILAFANHKIITYSTDCFEFRCSYYLSNMSLDLYSTKMKTKTRKMVGAIDYDRIHYQNDDELETIDWEYMINDVICLKEAVFNDFKTTNDTVATVPITSTGYVRRDCRIAVRGNREYRKKFEAAKLSPEAYMITRESYAGGYVHGNRFYGGVTVDDVEHFDIKSHYPSREMLNYMPEGTFAWAFHYEGIKLADSTFNKYLKTKCCLIRIQFNNLRLKRGVTAPYISKSKIANYFTCEFTREDGLIATDNGRVINCEGQPILNITELDLEIILKQYDSDGFLVLDLFVAKRGEFPEELKEVVNNYFIIKETTQEGIFRDKAKNKLNAIYGMSSTNPIRAEIDYDWDTMKWTEKNNFDLDEIEEKLAKYYKSYNSFMMYQFSTYTTAWARYVLFQLIELVGYENFLYCDTDSIFFRSSPEILERIDKWNENIIIENKKRGLGVQNLKGGISYYGTFENEKHCQKFRFLHSKCYAYTDDNGELHVTIAGVAKSNKQPEPNRVTIAEELGDIDNLEDEFVFHECGGTTSLYVENKPTVAYIDGHMTEYASACIIRKSDKKIGGCVEGIAIWEEAED